MSNLEEKIILPNRTLREEIISFYANNRVDRAMIKMIAKKIDGFSAQEIKELTQEMLAYAAVRGEERPAFQDFKNALHEILRNNSFSVASLGVSVISLLMQYAHHHNKSNPRDLYSAGMARITEQAQIIQSSQEVYNPLFDFLQIMF